MIRKFAIAHDYYNTKLTNVEIAKRHQVRPSAIPSIAQRVGRMIHKEPPPPEKWSLIKVAPKQLAYAEELFKRYGVKFETPERCELVEYFESSINQK